MTDALETLAARCGIADAYHDIWGGHHPTSARTRHALLTAMHFPAADPAAVLQQLDADEWAHALPPVFVVREGAEIRIPLVLSATASARTWRWTLVRESGASTTAEFIPAEQQRLGEHDALIRSQLELPPVTETGYHQLRLQQVTTAASLALPLIVVPQQCYQPAAIQNGGRIWGLTAQLYGLRSERNWGIGDFSDLVRLIELTAAAGGDLVGVNPLHALFPDNPAHISPYSPSQRSFVNVIYLDVEAVPEFATCHAARRRVASADFQARLLACRASDLVDYLGVASAKFEILEMLFEQFLTDGGERAADFAAYRVAQGKELEANASFEAIQAHFRAIDDQIWGWPVWPEEYRDPDSAVVAAFVASHADAVAYHAWLQWQADAQLGSVRARAEELGMAAGLYLDLAVGTHPGGAESWTWKHVLADGAHTGAPPDEINLMGQDWGLPPFVPHRLRGVAYAPFVDVLRANMKHAGALRIDHVMGLMRLFWVPAGIPASEGAYVHYPFEDMLGIVALESQRNRCLVIGEDLGTVPDGFRPRLAEAAVLSYHPLIFERYSDNSFRLPVDVPRQALVAAGTHDLPTLRGFWLDEDLDIRHVLQLFPTDELRHNLIKERGWDRGRLLRALELENLLPDGVTSDPEAMPDICESTVKAVHVYLARSPAQIMVVQLEDLLCVLEQPNLPGTLEHQHPNWQRRLPLTLEDWGADAKFADFTAAIRKERG
jgi:(1->4)-alpha-D-glucan 1-alpha-D-glucosylmutase